MFQYRKVLCSIIQIPVEHDILLLTQRLENSIPVQPNNKQWVQSQVVDCHNSSSIIFIEEILAGSLLLCILHRVELVNPGSEIVWISPKRDLKRLQELIHAH